MDHASSTDHATPSPAVAAPDDAAQRVRLRKLAFDAVTQHQTIARIMDSLASGHGGWVVTPNLDHLRRAETDESFAQMVRSADLVVADGMPLIWASRLAATPLPERVAGSTLVSVLAQAAAEQGRSLYLLGGDPGAAEAAAAVLQAQYPELRIVGTYCPPFGFERDTQQLQIIRDQLLEVKPDVVYVALGSPKQEWLIEQLKPWLPRTWWLGVGISLSFLCGQVKRAPQWMQRMGLEWVHRLMQEPGRLWRRYLIQGLPFAIRLFCWAWRQRQIAKPPDASGRKG